MLHRVIGVYGLEDCAELVAHATPAQLSHLFDLDLWRPSRPGLDERFDAERFGIWIEVLVEAGAEVAAAKLAAMPVPQIVSGLAHHVDVYDIAAVSSYETTGGDTVDYSRPIRDRVGCEIGGYHVAARRDDAWDAIVAVLAALDTHHPDRFVELMRSVRSRSHSLRERDGFHSLLENREQMMFDVGDEREQRRQRRGFLSAADARAFLEMSRTATPGALAASTAIARDYARSIEIVPDDDAPAVASAEESNAIALLLDAGIAPLHAPLALLESDGESPASAIQRCMRVVFERDPVGYGQRDFELAYLANMLISGCAIQGRAFTPREASDCAIATCNLGLERLPDLRDDHLLSHDLIGAFQLGWTALHQHVCLYSANGLLKTLSEMRVGEDDLQAAFNMLRVRLAREIAKDTPWLAADALDAVMVIDLPTWAALVALIAECPVIHGGVTASLAGRVHAIDPNAFAFIAEPRQIATIESFIRSLPALLQQ